jgi:radical SAM protein with 4Fe4S-binding SPASM domain
MQNARVRYSREDFGYLVAFPDGSIGLYTNSAGTLLESGSASPEQMEPHRLKQFLIKDNFHLRTPLIVWFEVTRRCNLTCTHCYIDAGHAREGELSTAEARSALEDMKRLGVFSLVLAGGEPYLRKDFPELLAYAAEDLDIITAVVTNGTYLTPEVLERVPRRNCRITLSVDGVAAHNKTRGGHSTFQLMQEKLRMMKAMGIPCSVSTVISKANIHELEELLRWCMDEDIIFRTVTFNPLGRGLLHLDTHFMDKDSAAASANVFMMQKRFESEKDKTTGLCVSKFFSYALNLMYMTRREHCSRSIAYLAANGEVFPCVSSAAAGAFGAGNIRASPFSEIWEHSFREMRAITWDHFIKETCHKCEFNSSDYFCANRCPVMSLVLNGTLLGCGASEFDREDLRLRTERLRSELGYVY